MAVTNRYLVVAANHQIEHDYLLIDTLYEQVITADDSKTELQRQAKELMKRDNAPIRQKHYR